jgi:hypothetical protein
LRAVSIRPAISETDGVVDLDEARSRRQLARYHERIGAVIASNRQAIGELFETGELFTREGTRAGRDLLLAHQHLLRVAALINQLSNTGEIPAPRSEGEVGAIYRELDSLMDRTQELTQRTRAFLQKADAPPG